MRIIILKYDIFAALWPSVRNGGFFAFLQTIETRVSSVGGTVLLSAVSQNQIKMLLITCRKQKCKVGRPDCLKDREAH